jgi:molecular chaperone HtpG
VNQRLETFQMETNFPGIIELLAKNLYPDPDVFVRELIQNAHDTIIRRREIQPDLAGRIEIECNPESQTVTFRDNGIGMDEADIKEFLSVIGSTGTGTARAELESVGRAAAYELIGQFGIGMLSAFVIADGIVVRTRKLKHERAFAWHNSGTTECILYEDDKESVGTEITLTVGGNYTYMLSEQRLQDAVVKYCDFIPFPITIQGRGPVNAMDAPWHRTVWATELEKRDAYDRYLRRRYPYDTPLDVIVVDIDGEYQVKGALYISDRHIPDVNSAGVVDVFVRRMLIRADDNDMLPQWAKFVRGVIDSRDLRPTAARDNIQRMHPSFEAIRDQLGQLIVGRLRELAREEPSKFLQINLWHHFHLKAMALHYDDFFEEVVGLLLVDTNKGLISLDDYLQKNERRPETQNKAPIYYFPFSEARTQFYRLADANNRVVIDASARFEEQLLEKYAKRNAAKVFIQRLDTTIDDTAIFQLPAAEEESRFQGLTSSLRNSLGRQGVTNVSVRIRSFAPVEVPAVIVLEPETEAELRLQEMVSQPWFRQHWEEIRREVVKQASRRPIYLSLNTRNPIVQQLAEAEEYDSVAEDLLFDVFVSAILYARNIIPLDDPDIVHKRFLHLCQEVLEQRRQNLAIQKTIERERRQMSQLVEQVERTRQERPGHIVLFMITPFADDYRRLEQAVRRVFERPPYCFQVLLARDRILKPNLSENVQEHLSRAHGFIAEISDLNPNVMLELGAAIFASDGRPIFALRRETAAADVPADLGDKLFLPYGSLDDPPEALEAAVREAVERDGRPAHDGMVELLRQRRELFLSRTLLAGLRARLSDEECAGVLSSYNTVEELLEAATNDLAESAHIPEFLAGAVQAELRQVRVTLMRG